MFVGVVVENFHKCRQQQEEEEARLREEKRQRRLEKRRRSERGEKGRAAVQHEEYINQKHVDTCLHHIIGLELDIIRDYKNQIIIQYTH